MSTPANVDDEHGESAPFNGNADLEDGRFSQDAFIHSIL